MVLKEGQQREVFLYHLLCLLWFLLLLNPLPFSPAASIPNAILIILDTCHAHKSRIVGEVVESNVCVTKLDILSWLLVTFIQDQSWIVLA